MNDPTHLFNHRVELGVGEPQGHLPIADPVDSEIWIVPIEVGGEVGEQRRDERAEVSEMVVGRCALEIVGTQGRTLQHDAVGAFDDAADMPLRGYLDDAATFQLVEVPIQRGLGDISQLVDQLAWSHRVTHQCLDYPEAYRVEEQVSGRSHRFAYSIVVDNIINNDNIRLQGQRQEP